MDNHGDDSYRPPPTSPDVSNYPPSGHEKAAMSHVDPGAQPPPYTEQHHVGAGHAPYPTQPAKYPTPDAYPPQPGTYPPQQPVGYPPQPGSYPPQQPVGYPPQPGSYPPQQPVGYPPQPGSYPPQHPGNVSYSSNNTVVVTQPGIVHDVRVGEEYPNNCSAIVFSCCVLWCCCCPLGLAAFILAILAGSSSTPEEAAQKLKISMWLNIAGIIIGILLSVTFYAT